MSSRPIPSSARLKPGPEPLYYQLEQALRDLIASGEVSEGEQLPGEHSICETYGVSRATVRRAIATLSAEGVVRAVPGLGTFVVSRHFVLSVGSGSSVGEAVRLGGGDPGSRVIEARRQSADSEIGALLRIPVGTEVFRMSRLRLAGDEPIAYTVSFFPYEPVGRFLESRTDSPSLFKVLNEDLALRVQPGPQRFLVARASRYDAQILGTKVGAPLVYSWAVDCDEFDRPIEYVKAYYRADRFIFEAPPGAHAIPVLSHQTTDFEIQGQVKLL